MKRNTKLKCRFCERDDFKGPQGKSAHERTAHESEYRSARHSEAHAGLEVIKVNDIPNIDQTLTAHTSLAYDSLQHARKHLADRRTKLEAELQGTDQQIEAVDSALQTLKPA